MNLEKGIGVGLIIVVPPFRGFLMGVESCPDMIVWVCARAFASSFLPFLLLLCELPVSIVLPIPLKKGCHCICDSKLFE